MYRRENFYGSELAPSDLPTGFAGVAPLGSVEGLEQVVRKAMNVGETLSRLAKQRVNWLQADEARLYDWWTSVWWEDFLRYDSDPHTALNKLFGVRPELGRKVNKWVNGPLWDAIRAKRKELMVPDHLPDKAAEKEVMEEQLKTNQLPGDEGPAAKEVQSPVEPVEDAGKNDPGIDQGLDAGKGDQGLLDKWGNPYGTVYAGGDAAFYAKQREPSEQLMCTAEVNPVCGEDGVEYSNSCHAGNAGVKWAPGPCALQDSPGEAGHPVEEDEGNSFPWGWVLAGAVGVGLTLFLIRGK